MNFDEALEFSKKFPACHPKVFKGFTEWGVYESKKEGYVVLADAALMTESQPNQLEDYVKTHKLKIDHFKNYLMICSLY